MNLQPVPVEDIPPGNPLPWRLYDRNGYIVFARGGMVASREQLASLLSEGPLHDPDTPQKIRECGHGAEFKAITPGVIFPPVAIKPKPGESVQLRPPNRTLPVG